MKNSLNSGKQALIGVQAADCRPTAAAESPKKDEKIEKKAVILPILKDSML